MRSRFDSLWLGLIVGIMVPAIALFMFYYSSFTRVPLSYFIQYSIQINILPQVLSMCVLPNLGIFFLFMWRNHYLSARGIIFATIIAAFLVLGIKLFT
jgi:hypothetical protein